MLSTNLLGRYQIIRELARSNDIVFEAIDPSTGRRIALKELQIPANLVGQGRRDRIQRFTREARAAARLTHQNIVRILEHGQVGSAPNERYYIAMEFLEGQSLRDVLRNRGALPLAEALRIAIATADGLEFAHQNGVVHRDVKPDNIHLEPDGRVVLTDFGIARLSFEPTLTADGQIFGTPSYMSPEQVTGKNIDRRSDVFSLGVMLYEMVAGRKPFTGDSVITITYNIMNMEPPALADAPMGVNQIIRKATAKNLGDRYATATQMIEDLRLVAQGQPPRYASTLPPAALASRSSPYPPGNAPAPASRALLPAPPSGARPLPQPVFGGGGALPGARPLPRSAPASPNPSAAPPYANGAPQPYGMVAPVYVAPRSGGGTDWKFLLGWIGVAVIIGLLLLALMLAFTTASEKFRQNSGAAATARARSAADSLYAARRFEDALTEYVRVAEASRGEQRATAL